MKLVMFFLCILVTSAYGTPPYTLCIDGGGSKTLLQVIDQQGNVISFTKNNTLTDRTEARGSNVNTVGHNGLRLCLQELFDGITIGEEKKDLKTILPECNVIAGMAGVGDQESKKAVLIVFQEVGIAKEKIILLSDAELNLELIESNGIMLIAGTGSICLGKKDRVLHRVGGLGRILGDEGSGYYIGLQAIKAALAQEYGWGQATTLTPILKEFFHVSELKQVIRIINLGELSPGHVAKVAPLVFEQAQEKDAVASVIVEQAAQHLSFLLTTMIHMTNLTEGEIQLWGGVFKGRYADTFIKKIEDYSALRQGNIKVVNKAHQNSALLFAQKTTLKKNMI